MMEIGRQLTWTRLSKEHLPFFEKVINENPKWKDIELQSQSLEDYILLYNKLNGEWRIWEQRGCKVAITFHLTSAESNKKPWLGTILVIQEKQGQGLAKTIIKAIETELKLVGKRVLFAGVLANEYGWIDFLSKCGFQQYKTEDYLDNTYLILIRPLE